MSKEIDPNSYWERTNNFLSSNNARVNKFFLLGPDGEFDVDVDWCTAMYPDEMDYTKVRSVIYAVNHYESNIYNRLVFELELDPEKVRNGYVGSISEMMTEFKRSSELGEPICAISFGVDRITQERVVCLHAVSGMTPDQVLKLVKTHAEIQLFGKLLDFLD